MQGLVAAICMTLAATAAHAQTTLADLRDKARPLLIFAGPHDKRVEQQFAELSAHASGARERDIRVALLTASRTNMHEGARPPEASLSPEEGQQLRRRFHIAPNEFAVLLIGKDGGEKLRANQPIAWEKLASTIDAMPMRQTEAHQR